MKKFMILYRIDDEQGAKFCDTESQVFDICRDLAAGGEGMADVYELEDVYAESELEEG